MTNKLVNKIPCTICHHPKDVHWNEKTHGHFAATIPGWGEHWCHDCGNIVDQAAVLSFHTYKPNNLAFIEQQYDAQGKL